MQVTKGTWHIRELCVLGSLPGNKVMLTLTSTIFGNNIHISGGFRNPERGGQLLAREARPQIFGLSRPLPARWKS